MATEMRLLMVDDDPVDLELTRRLLAGTTRMQFKVDTAACLRSATEFLHRECYGVVLLDLNLPDTRGLATLDATLDAMRRENSDVPIIVLSGLSDEDTALRSLDHGAQDYLVKGHVTSDTLVNSIRYAIQRQQLLQEITSAKELLEKKNQRLAELYDTAHRFVDNVSHEFRTPLTVIKEYTSLVRDGLVESAEEQRHFLDIVGDRADDLNTMVDDMLDVSKLEAGLLGAWRKNHNVAEIVGGLRSALERKGAVKNVAVEFDIDPALPDVYCDDEKVRRVLINLTVNAIKFCHEQGNVRVWAKDCPDAQGVVIGVTDNGPGIDDESLATIFERFKQLQGNVRGSCKGFGLGLNIAKELVDLNFGEMNVLSQIGQGTTFTFTLPPADPLEVMRRYLHRVAHLRNGSSTVTLITATIDDSHELSTSDDVDAYLYILLRRNDLVFRIADHKWLIVLATNEIELERFYEKAVKTRNEINRNRIHGPLPALALQTVGTWHATVQFREVLTQLRQTLEQRGAVHV